MGDMSACQLRFTGPRRLCGGGERSERIEPVPRVQCLAIGTPGKLAGGGLLAALVCWPGYIRQAWR